MAAKENFLVRDRVKIITETLTSLKSVELLNHEAEGIELVLVGSAVDKEDALKKESADFDICHVRSDAFEDCSEARSHVLQTGFL